MTRDEENLWVQMYVSEAESEDDQTVRVNNALAKVRANERARIVTKLLDIARGLRNAADEVIWGAIDLRDDAKLLEKVAAVITKEGDG